MEMRYVLSKIAFPPRLCSAAFGAAGCAVQVILPGACGFLLGVIVMVLVLLFMFRRNFKNKPMDIGKEDWQPVFVREFDRIKSNLQLTREKRYSVIYRGGFGWFIAIVLLVIAFFLSGRIAAWGRWSSRTPLSSWSRSCSRETSPCGRRRSSPSPMKKSSILSSEQAEGGDIIITPLPLRLDKDKEDRQIPEDVRLLVEPRRKPADFLGVQFTRWP